MKQVLNDLLLIGLAGLIVFLSAFYPLILSGLLTAFILHGVYIFIKGG